MMKSALWRPSLKLILVIWINNCYCSRFVSCFLPSFLRRVKLTKKVNRISREIKRIYFYLWKIHPRFETKPKTKKKAETYSIKEFIVFLLKIFILQRNIFCWRVSVFFLLNSADYLVFVKIFFSKAQFQRFRLTGKQK